MVVKKVLLGIGCLVTLSSCGLFPNTSSTTIEPGYVGIKIDLYGGDKGIDGSQLVTGKVWYDGYTQQVISFPTFVRTYPFTDSKDEGAARDESIQFSVGGTPVRANVGASFAFYADDRVKQYYKTYRKDPDAFMASDFRNGLRDCFSSVSESMTVSVGGMTRQLTPPDLPMNQERLMFGVRECLSKKFPATNVTTISLLSPIKLPDNVQAAIDSQYAAQQAATAAVFNQKKAEAEQKARVAEAQADAAVARTKADATAYVNAKTAASITPELIRMKQLEVEQARWQKWNGQMPANIQTQNLQLPPNSQPEAK